MAFQKHVCFSLCVLLLLLLLSLWTEEFAQKKLFKLHLLLGFVPSLHLPDTREIHSSVWDWAFLFILIKTMPVKFPPPNHAPVLKRQQPPAPVLLRKKRGHRSCKATQTCEMGFTAAQLPVGWPCMIQSALSQEKEKPSKPRQPSPLTNPKYPF